MQEGRTDVLSRLKREKVLEIQRTRGEKKRDEWRRTEECAGRVDERRREEERIDEREREENRGLVAAQTRSIRPLPPTSPPPPLPRRARSRTERGTWFLRECTDTQRDLPILFSELTCLSFSLSLSCSFPALAVFVSLFFHPSRSRQSAILRGNVLPIPLRRVDFLTMSLARTYCLS